jgi:hypothetical protein
MKRTFAIAVVCGFGCSLDGQNLGWVTTSGGMVDDGGDDDSATGGGGDDGHSDTGAPGTGTGSAESCAPMDGADDDPPPLDDGDDGGPECSADVHEPNDTPETATPLDINPVPATLCDHDVDYWTFTLDFWPAFVEPSLSSEPFGYRVTVEYADIESPTMLYGELQSVTGQIDMTGWVYASGEYTVRVERGGTEIGTTAYEMYVDHGPSDAAVESCWDAAENDPCSFDFVGRAFAGTCRNTMEEGVVCVPDA